MSGLHLLSRVEKLVRVHRLEKKFVGRRQVVSYRVSIASNMVTTGATILIIVQGLYKRQRFLCVFKLSTTLACAHIVQDTAI